MLWAPPRHVIYPVTENCIKKSAIHICSCVHVKLKAMLSTSLWAKTSNCTVAAWTLALRISSHFVDTRLLIWVCMANSGKSHKTKSESNLKWKVAAEIIIKIIIKTAPFPATAKFQHCSNVNYVCCWNFFHSSSLILDMILALVRARELKGMREGNGSCKVEESNSRMEQQTWAAQIS